MRSGRILLVPLRRLDLVDWLFVTASTVAAVWSTTPILTADSGGYLQSGLVFTDPIGGLGYNTWGGLSFVGDSMRAWPTVLFYSAFPSADGWLGNTGRVSLQWLLALVALLFFAHRVSKTVAPERPLVGMFIRAFVYLFALTETVTTHVLTIGAEGPALILALVALALTLQVVDERQASAWGGTEWTIAGFAVAAASLLSLVRLTGLLMLAAVVAILVFSAVRRGVPLPRRQQLAYVLAGLLVVVGVTAYASAVSERQSEAWKPANALTEKNFRAFYAVSPRLNAPYHEDVRASLPDDAPACLADFPPDVQVWTELANYGVSACSEADREWIESNYFRMMVGYWLDQPRSTSSWAWQGSRAASSVWEFPQAKTVVSSAFDRVYFSTTGHNAARTWALIWLAGILVCLAYQPLRTVGYLAILGLAGVAWIAFVASYMDIWDSHARKAWPFYFVAVSLTAAAAIGILAHLQRTFQRWRAARGNDGPGLET